MLPISPKFGGIIIRGQINPIPGGYLKVYRVVALSLKRLLDGSQSGPQPP
jgi:hypothetical protein